MFWGVSVSQAVALTVHFAIARIDENSRA